MTTRVDAARILAHCDEAARATSHLLEAISATLLDDCDTPQEGRVRDQLRGAQMKARSAWSDLGKATAFARGAIELTGGAR